MKLVQVTAPYFCAGIEIKDGRCTRAAPILKWTVGKTEQELFSYFSKKKWKAVTVGG